MSWHNGRTRRTPNPDSEEVVRDCITNGGRSAADSILARSPSSNKGRIRIAQTSLSLSFIACGQNGGPYIPGCHHSPGTQFGAGPNRIRRNREEQVVPNRNEGGGAVPWAVRNQELQIGFPEGLAAAIKHTVIGVKKTIGKVKKYVQLKIVTATKQKASAH